MAGNNVSHANNKTRRRFLPNLQQVSLPSEVLGRSLRFRASTQAIRSVEKHGGVDGYLTATSNQQLSKRAQVWKREIAAAKSGKTPVATDPASDSAAEPSTDTSPAS